MPLHRLLHPSYLIALALLIINDHYWKATYANALTGKLSDVVGLWVFAWFWATILPRYQRWVWSATALLFLWWKTPLADSFLSWANSWGWPLVRTIDYTDYWALLILPIAWWFYQQQPKQTWQVRPVYLGLIFISLSSFVATSVAQRVIIQYPQGDVLLEKAVRIKYPPQEALALLRTGEWPITAVDEYKNPRAPITPGSRHNDRFQVIYLSHLYRIDSLRLIHGEWLYNIHFQLLPIRDGKRTKLQWINVTRAYDTDLQDWRQLKALQEYYELNLETAWLNPILRAAKE